MEAPRLVASDVDGTLLGLGPLVSERTAAAVARVRESGTPFVLVTGRPPRWVPDVARSAGHDGLAVCANGAVLYDVGADRVLWQRCLEPVQLSDLADAADSALPGSALAAERVGATAFDDDVRQFVAENSYQHPWAGSDQVDVSRAEVLGHPAVKLLVEHGEMTSGQMAEALEAVLGDAFAVTFSTDSGMVEISAAGVTKATGLADVAQRYGVRADDVVAFGDMPNDVPMLRWAGHGVAMSGGHPEALAAADEVTAPSTEDGVALVLERWF
ncbi:HAD family hydrolase [Umezawaea beigongshangensis]|uniref:HAD family hydrolase n=1 Tax=Umezawaea beigongshangensis TaxID=2780383 RepID=UPI0018F21F09|nr:HAD family hydrolase [Umezawaea beigongshangensis]